MIKDFLKKNWLNLIIIIAFVIGAFYMAQFHELWSDEAQSWLIARDLSVPEIIGYTRYEGTPPLWVLTIKFFMMLGVTYETYYIIPIIFMGLGLLFLYTKFDIPWYLKILFPFTYYVFYQTTIVVRSYSLILLGISMVFYYFPKRYEKMWKFYFAMLFFMNISLHTFFVAGSFYGLMLLFLIEDRKKLESKTKKQAIILSAVLFITFFAVLLMVLPNANVGFGGNGGRNLFYIFGESTFANRNKVVQIIATVTVFVLYCYILVKRFIENKNANESIRDLEKTFVVFPLVVMYLFLHVQVRYFAVLYFIITLFLINNKKYPVVKIALVVIFSVQIVWNVKSCMFDYNEKYAVGEDIANFLMDINYKDKVLDTINYHVVEVSPYFDENIFYHSYKTDDAFYSWNLDTDYLDTQGLLDSNADIYIIPILTSDTDNGETRAVYSINVVDFMSDVDYDKYNVYTFKAKISQKGILDENDTFLIYVNDKVQNEMDEKGIHLEKENRVFNVYDTTGKIYKKIDFSKL